MFLTCERVCFLGMNGKKGRKLPFYMAVERNKGKGDDASPSSSEGEDVQIECGFVSLLVVWDCLFGRWGCAWWGSDVGCWDNEKGEESGSVFNV